MTFLNAALLFGLAAVVVPPVVHLFSRRKFDVVDWAAMRFLQLSQKTKRKMFFEQFWLMLLRMALVALVVAAVSAPQLTTRWLGTTAGGGPRNVVLLIDGSASMAYKQAGGTAADAAKTWADDYLGEAGPGRFVSVGPDAGCNRRRVPRRWPARRSRRAGPLLPRPSDGGHSAYRGRPRRPISSSSGRPFRGRRSQRRFVTAGLTVIAPIPGWHLWHGAAFSLIYLALLLIHLIAGGEKSARLRAVSLLAGGLAGFVLIFICTKWPPSVSGDINGSPTTFVAHTVLPGLVLAENLALLTAIIGAMQLRNRASAPHGGTQTSTTA